jgi:hypothetical protein
MWLMCSLYRNKCRNVTLVGATMGKGTREKWRRLVVIHIYMKTTQGISLCICLYLKLAKMPCFSFYLLYFFLLQNQRIGGRNSLGGGGIGTSGRGRWWERGRRMNMMQIMSTHVCKCKNDICWDMWKL